MNTKHVLLTLCGLLLFGSISFAQVKIGDNPGTINANSVLEVESTNKGLLLPRVALTNSTATAPMTAHIAGMTVYNTATAGDVTPGYYYNDGTKWVKLGAVGAATASGAWSLTGNAGTAPGSNTLGAATDGNFWGTTDAQNLIVGTNGTKRMLFDQRGNAYGGANTGVTSTTSTNSFAWGSGNTVSGENSATFGLSNSNQTKNSLVFGNGNTLSPGTTFQTNRGTILGGGGNTVTGGNSYNSIINGSQVTVSGDCFESIITGFQTTVTNSQKVVVSGQGHSVTNGLGSAVFGNFNGTSSAHGLITGAGNSIGANAEYGVALGQSNAIAAGHLNAFALGKGVTTTAAGQLAAGFAGGYKLYTNVGSSTGVDIIANGNVGIGTTAPATKLEVNSGTSGTSGLRLTQLTSASTPSTLPVASLGVTSTGDVVVTGSGLVNVNASLGTTTGPVLNRTNNGYTPNWGTIKYNVITSNIGGGYNSTTGVYTIPSTGIYSIQCTFTVYWDGSAANGYLWGSLLTNAQGRFTSVSQGSDGSSFSSNEQCSTVVTITRLFNAGDTVTPQAYLGTASSSNIRLLETQTGVSETTNFFSVTKL